MQQTELLVWSSNFTHVVTIHKTQHKTTDAMTFIKDNGVHMTENHSWPALQINALKNLHSTEVMK